jgi:hypothetical protein
MLMNEAPSVHALLHPTETSRLALALVAALLGLGVPLAGIWAAGGFKVVIDIALALTIFIATLWLGSQMRRARLLGRSVSVDKDTFPELQALVEEVCTTLHYERRIEVYVTESASPSIAMSSLLGTRIIVIEGSLAAELLEGDKRGQLAFLIGRHVGALRAKLTRLDLLVLIMNWASTLPYVAPFLLPYYRANAYSGDQIGMVCCGDLHSSLEATRRLLVGGEMAAKLSAGAVLPQSLLVKRRLLPRLAQLLEAEPHVTNRYANLICFGRHHDPDAWLEVRALMDGREAGYMDVLWQRSPYSRSRYTPPPRPAAGRVSAM